MKKNHLFGSFLSVVFTLVLCLSAFGFSGCEFANTLVSGWDYTGKTLSNSASWTYTPTNDTFIVDESVSNVSIYGNISGKDLYMALVNTSDTAIEKSYVKTSDNVSNIRSASDSDLDGELFIEDFFENEWDKGHSELYNWRPDPKEISARSANASDFQVSQSLITNYQTGTTKKNFYIMNSKNSYSTAQGTLRGITTHCNVWVIDSYYGNSSKTNNNGQIDDATAQKFADAFEKCYPMVRAVYGRESDEIYNSYSYYTRSYVTENMNAVSDTGIKVNIVVYDLYGDREGGTLGFFATRDYYTNSIATNSNVGKYFYVDSYYAVSRPEDIILTLVHEFQHMINFSVKTMEDGLSIDTNFNEMLSLLCEDMMVQFLNNSGYSITDDASPRARLRSFMIQYFACGIREYDQTAKSYANAYAFGSWLCRQYGGAKLVQKMMSNGMVNNECIVAAVNSINRTSFTFDDLFAQFVKACYGKDSTYTFNQDAAKSFSYNNYDYPMTAIDFEDDFYDLSRFQASTSSGGTITLKDFLIRNYGAYIDSKYNYRGPAVAKSGVTLTSTLRPSYGMLLQRYGTIRSNSIKINFKTEAYKSSEKNYYTKDGMKIILYIK